jgi:hypothetical protein
MLFAYDRFTFRHRLFLIKACNSLNPIDLTTTTQAESSKRQRQRKRGAPAASFHRPIDRSQSSRSAPLPFLAAFDLPPLPTTAIDQP